MKQLSDRSHLLETYLRKVLETNQSLNLTRIVDWDQAKLLMLEDSLSALPEFIESPSGPYGDLGTGGGFPGVPLGIVSERETWLVDSRAKKIEAIKAMFETMGISHQFRYSSERIETLATEYPETFAVVTARALTSLPSLLEIASPLLQENGELISYQATVDDETLSRADEVANIVGLEQTSQRSFLLSDGETRRTILTFRKTSKPSIRLPRRIGVAQKKPLA